MKDKQTNTMYESALNDLRRAAKKLKKVSESGSDSWFHPMAFPQNEIAIELKTILDSFYMTTEDIDNYIKN